MEMTEAQAVRACETLYRLWLQEHGLTGTIKITPKETAHNDEQNLPELSAV